MYECFVTYVFENESLLLNIKNKLIVLRIKIAFQAFQTDCTLLRRFLWVDGIIILKMQTYMNIQYARPGALYFKELCILISHTA